MPVSGGVGGALRMNRRRPLRETRTSSSKRARSTAKRVTCCRNVDMATVPDSRVPPIHLHGSSLPRRTRRSGVIVAEMDKITESREAQPIKPHRRSTFKTRLATKRGN